MVSRIKNKWYQDPVKLYWVFIGLSISFLLISLLNIIEIAHIRHDLFNYYLYP